MNAKELTQMDAWEKWEWLWNSFFYASVLISFGILLFNEDRTEPLWLTGC